MKILIHDTDEAQREMDRYGVSDGQIEAIKGKEIEATIREDGDANVPCIDPGCGCGGVTWIFPESAFTILSTKD